MRTHCQAYVAGLDDWEVTTVMSGGRVFNCCLELTVSLSHALSLAREEKMAAEGGGGGGGDLGGAEDEPRGGTDGEPRARECDAGGGGGDGGSSSFYPGCIDLD